MKRKYYYYIIAVVVLIIAILFTHRWYSGCFIKVNVQEKEMGPLLVVCEYFYGLQKETRLMRDKLSYSLESDGIKDIKEFYAIHKEKDYKGDPIRKIGFIIGKDDHKNFDRVKDTYNTIVLEKGKYLVVHFPLKTKLSFYVGFRKSRNAFLEMCKEKNNELTAFYSYINEEKKEAVYFVKITE